MVSGDTPTDSRSLRETYEAWAETLERRIRIADSKPEDRSRASDEAALKFARTILDSEVARDRKTQ